MKKTKAKETAAGAELRRRASVYEADAERAKKDKDPALALRQEGRADGLLDAATFVDEYLAKQKTGEELPDVGDVADLAMMQRADSRLDDIERRVIALEAGHATPEAIARFQAPWNADPVHKGKVPPPSLRKGGLLEPKPDPSVARDGVRKVLEAIKPRAKALRPDDGHTNGVLDRPAMAILLALRKRHPETTSKQQAAILSGYSVNSGSFGKALTQLRAGYIEGEASALRLTVKGHEHPLPALEIPRAIVAFWAERVSAPASSMLQVMVTAYPRSVSRDALSDKTGYSATSGSFGKALTELRKLELVEGWRASEALMSVLPK